jgi:HK97 family phage major capsid protein
MKAHRDQVATSPMAVPAIRPNGITPDDFGNAFKNFVTTRGHDLGAFKGVRGVEAYKGSGISLLNTPDTEAVWSPRPGMKSYKASNATDMNIGTAADGGNSVATPFHSSIITRRDEFALPSKLGCTLIPGVGTTVSVVTDNEADGEFVSTNEVGQFDQDAPAISKVDLTLTKYSKRTLVSDELMHDTAVNIMDYVHERVAIGWAKTLNGLIVTEVEANGTQFVRGGSTTAIADGEIESLVYNNTFAPYADGFDISFVMNSATYGVLRKISANARVYGNEHVGPTQAGNGGMRTLLEFPVHFSGKVDAIAARAKSILFGSWGYLLYRESPSLDFLFDPYTRADYGQDRLLWYFRTDFGVAQAGAVGYFEHDLT